MSLFNVSICLANSPEACLFVLISLVFRFFINFYSALLLFYCLALLFHVKHFLKQKKDVSRETSSTFCFPLISFQEA